MNIFSIIYTYPIGTKVRLADDSPGEIREVYGYEWIGEQASIIFRDGTKLNASRLDLIVEVKAGVE